MKRLFALGLMLGILGFALSTTLAAPAAKDRETRMEALRELQDFIGKWNGSGAPKPAAGPRDPVWKETVAWNWRFKGDDVWLSVDFTDAKFLKNAEIRYLLDKKKYQLIGTPVTGKDPLTFEGVLKDEKLEFVRTDPKTKEVQRIRMNTAAEGVRFIYQVDRKAEGGTIWKWEYSVASTRDGKSLGKKEKGPECVVSGGLGTTAVSYGGETFYVCCSGCAEAFKENPKKYVDEFKAKKKK